jgi:CBS domain-containing protein
MESVKVKDLMVPIENYATVSQEATLYEAVLALEEAQEKFDQRRYKHRAVLAFDQKGKIVGKLSQLDVIKGLEPRYKEILDTKHLSRWGLTAQFLKSMMSHYHLWEKPLDDICRKASELKVKDIMYTPTEGEYVSQDASLNEAIHQLVVGHHQSLLVTEGEDIVGVLRLTDVFKHICETIKACKI